MTRTDSTLILVLATLGAAIAAARRPPTTTDR